MNNENLGTSQITDKLISYLRDFLKDQKVRYASPLTQLQGGYETLTYRFKLKGVEDDLSKFLVLRLYPQFYGIQNAIWESTVQNVLAGEGYPVPKVHFVCTDMSILGGAFFIMDYIPGKLLISAPYESVPELMGTIHAELHKIDPKPLVRALREGGVDEYAYSLNSRFAWLDNKTNKLPWIRECVEWLIENRPPEPERLSVCHGDFHALNILIDDGVVTGVLDWPGFAIADPIFDIANTIVLTTIPAKYLMASMEGFSSVDWDFVGELYLSAYRRRVELDLTNLDYYRVRRCVMGLVQGTEGQKVWQHPMIIADLVGYIHKVTGIQISKPA
jgi:aminoglycoside phosphotransferase (APT) family kinase protein